MKNKSVLKRLATILGIICALFLALVLALVIIYKINFPGPKTEFASVDEFVAEGGFIYTDVPECAENLRYFYCKEPFGCRSIISYEIKDPEEYDIFMEDLKDYILIEKTGTYYSDGTWVGNRPEWNKYIENSSYYGVTYTEEELEEIAYLEQNYTNMDYKEILSLSRHKYGFLYGYGAKVSDYSKSTAYGAFPVCDWYYYAVDGSLDDYTVISYDYYDGSYRAFFVDEESKHFVIIRVSTF